MPWYVAWPLLIAFGALALHFVAVRSVYFPVKHPGGFWSLQAELGATDIWLDSTDRVRIHGWFVACPGSRRVTLFLHGNTGNITHRGQHFREITAAGSSVLMIDYRGYGKSTGRPSEDGLYADAEAAHEHLLKTSRPQEIIVHGESLGAAVAVDLASRHQCGGVVLESAFTSASDVAGTVLPMIGPLLIRSFDSRRKITRVQARSFSSTAALMILSPCDSAERCSDRSCVGTEILLGNPRCGAQRHRRERWPGVPNASEIVL
jgi:pimeloyl-ACP methyl ester carboxylesterase